MTKSVLEQIDLGNVNPMSDAVHVATGTLEGLLLRAHVHGQLEEYVDHEVLYGMEYWDFPAFFGRVVNRRY